MDRQVFFHVARIYVLRVCGNQRFDNELVLR